MRYSDDQILQFIDEGIERTFNSRNWEELEKYSASIRGFTFGLEICGFLDDNNLIETMTVSYWEERNRKAYSTGAANICVRSKVKL